MVFKTTISIGMVFIATISIATISITTVFITTISIATIFIATISSILLPNPLNFITAFLPPTFPFFLMNEFFYFSIIVILLSYIFLTRKKKKSKKFNKHPSGDYVLKIVINKEKRKENLKIIETLKRAVFEIAPSLFEDSSLYNKWKLCGEGKVVLVGDLSEFKTIKQKSKEENIPCSNYEDLLLMIGPGLKSKINEFTGHLKLY